MFFLKNQPRPLRLLGVVLFLTLLAGCSKKEPTIPDVTDDPVTTPISIKDLPIIALTAGVVRGGSLEVNLEAVDAIRVTDGDVAQAWLDISQKPLQCRVTSVLRDVNLSTGQAIAWLKPMRNEVLSEGDFYTAQIIIRVKHHVLTLPQDAIYIREGKPTVLLEQTAKDGTKTYVPTFIETGTAFNGDIEIVSGLTPGDQVVTQAGIGFLYPDFKANADD
jgi:multidrug efflux pump subunit AcrA (membrane-fusion protein)